MALIPVYHTVASYYAVDPTANPASSPIVEGTIVALTTDGYVTTTGVTTKAIGVAGDNFSATGSDGAAATANTPFGYNVVVSGSGSTQWTQNRVSDFFNETKGSGKMTVYTGVGEFYSDQYASGQSWTPGAKLYATSAGLITPTAGGATRVVGFVIEGPTAYPSGVPGVDTSGSVSLGTYIRFQLGISG